MESTLQNYFERCHEIQKQLEKMPVSAYIFFFQNALPNFKKYHPADWMSIKKSIDVEYVPDKGTDLPWPYSCFRDMYETAKSAFNDSDGGSKDPQQ